MNQQIIFQAGNRIGTPIYIIALEDTFTGDIQDLGSSVNNGAGHEAEDGDLCIDDNGGTMIAYRIPDLSGTPGTAIVGEQSFNLSSGRCFVLTPDYRAVQIQSDDPSAAIDCFRANKRHGSSE